MKSQFPLWLRPSDAEFTELWGGCWFSVDANVLLHMYRYGEEYRTKLWAILERLRSDGRLWIPHQVALDYLNNRANAISQSLRNYDIPIALLGKVLTTLREDSASRIAPFAEEPVRAAVTRIIDDLRALHRDQRALILCDPIMDQVFGLLEGLVGAPYCETDHQEKCQEAADRYAKRRPPGYGDESKEENQYGDAIMWFQLVDEAANRKQPLVFITDDRKKGDWFEDAAGLTIGPRRELREEMLGRVGVTFYAYEVRRFMELAGEHFGLDVAAATSEVDAVQDVYDVPYVIEMRRGDGAEWAPVVVPLREHRFGAPASGGPAPYQEGPSQDSDQVAQVHDPRGGQPAEDEGASAE